MDVKPLFYAAEWFSTIFAYSLNMELTLRVWDMFFYEGSRYLLRVALGILKLAAAEICSMEFDEIIVYLKEFSTTLGEQLIYVADSFEDFEGIVEELEDKYDPERDSTV